MVLQSNYSTHGTLPHHAVQCLARFVCTGTLLSFRIERGGWIERV